MSDSEIHSILFRGIIARLNSLAGHDGRNIHDDQEGLPAEMYLCWQVRPPAFAHNYERDKFLHHRDVYSVTNIHGNRYIMAKVVQRNYVTIYKKPFELLFGREAGRVVETLEKLMNKFYDEVTLEDISPIREADRSNNNSPSNTRIQHEV